MVIFCNIFAQEVIASEELNTEVEKTEIKKEKSEYEKKLDTIKYGLNSDIIKLIQDLQAKNDNSFNSELQKIFFHEKNISLKNEILKFFAYQKNDSLQVEVAEILKNFLDYNNDFVVACINYLTNLKIKNPVICESLKLIISAGKSELKERAILALGKLGTEQDAVYLSEVYETENYESKEALIIRQAIMQTLIDLQAPETFDFLQEKAIDTYENSVIRSRAITALGKIGNEKAIKTLIDSFEDNDPIIREAVIAGLLGFTENEEAQHILLQGFKDENYKVRLKAIEISLEIKSLQSIPYILYRAKTDPETVVKNKAIEAISQSNDLESLNWLKEKFLDKNAPTNLRVKIAREVLEHNFDFIISDIQNVILTSLDDRQTKDFIYDLGKNISHIKEKKLISICEFFLLQSEAKFKSVGLDMFKVNTFPELVTEVEKIANDKKNGALQNRASKLLETESLELKSKSDKNTELKIIPEGSSKVLSKDETTTETTNSKDTNEPF